MSKDKILRSTTPHDFIPDVSVGEFCYEKLKSFGNNVCWIDAESGEELTANEVVEKSSRIASSLLRYGLSKEDIVCCFSANNLNYALLQIAIYFLGIPITPAKPNNGIYELEQQIIDSSATFIFTSVTNSPKVKDVLSRQMNVKKVFVFDGEVDGFISFNELLAKSTSIPKIPYFSVDTKNDPWAIVYSSGSTGPPKGVVLTNYAAVTNIAVLLAFELKRRSGDDLVSSGHYPFGHISGLMMGLMWICAGVRVVLHAVIDFEKIVAAVERYKVTSLGLFPAFGQVLLNTPLGDKYDMSSLTEMLTGGAAFPKQIAVGLIKKYNLRQFLEYYGMSEYFNVSFNYETEYIPGNCGKACSLTEFKIVDLRTGDSLNPNENGEICVRGSFMMKEYLNNLQATAEAIDSDGWLHTGDIGYYDSQGRLFIVDRIKELIKYQMWSVSPTEIEDCLLSHPAVAEAVVVGVPHPSDTQLPRAYVKLLPGQNATAEEIQRYIKDKMASHKHLRGGVVFTDYIPRTVSGKVDRPHFKKLVTENKNSGS